MKRSWRSVWALAMACGTLLAGSTRAEVAPADSALDAHMRTLSDSTDAWFGVTAAPVDTAGLDSALAAGLARPLGARRAGERRTRLSWSPALGFNRVDGGQLGLSLGLRSPVPGRLTGRAQYTTGTEDVIGEGAWTYSWAVRSLHSRLGLRVAGGRWTEPLERDRYEAFFSTLGAVMFGRDSYHYLRRDGWRTTLRLGTDRASASLGWRDQLESSLRYTTRWNVFGNTPDPRDNRSVAEGRIRELAPAVTLPVPGTRFRAQVAHWISDPKLGSDRFYRRSRGTLAGDVSIGSHWALVPRVSYGRLRGEALPQESFTFGGTGDMRTIESHIWNSTGRLFVRNDLVLVDDLPTLLHLRLPAWLPLQGSVYGAAGASWGRDPFTGEAVSSRRDWPKPEEWLFEAGGGLGWRPGIPDPLMTLRFEYSVPVGPGSRSPAFTISFQRPLELPHEP